MAYVIAGGLKFPKLYRKEGRGKNFGQSLAGFPKLRECGKQEVNFQVFTQLQTHR